MRFKVRLLLPKKIKILSIAGSDPSTLAGIQGDIKTAQKLKAEIATVITSVTAQNSHKIHDTHHLPNNIIQKQIEAILEDGEFSFIKIGMVGNATEIIAQTLKEKAPNIPIILDPIIISTSGFELLSKSHLENFKKSLIPLCYLITPNIKEAEILSGIKINNFQDSKKAAKIIQNLGVKNVLITGGDFDLENQKISHFLLTEKNEEIVISSKRLFEKRIRGTGCRLSTSIAIFLNQNMNLEKAIKKANKFVFQSIKNGRKFGEIFIMN